MINVLWYKMFKLSLLYALAGIITQLFQYITLPLIIKNVSIEQFGIISLLETITTLSITFITFSMERAAQRFYFDKMIDNSVVFINCLVWIIIVGFLYTLIGFLLEYTGILVSPFFPYGYVLMIFAGLCSAILSLTNVTLQIHKKPIQFAAINFLKGTLQLGFIYYFIQIRQFGLAGFILSTVLTSLLISCLCLIILPKIVYKKIYLKLIKEMLVYSLPIVPTVVSAWILNMQGRFFLTKFSTLTEVGGYFFWYKISLIYFLCSSAVNSAITPDILRWLSDDGDISQLVDSYIRPLIKIFGIVSIVFIIISDHLANALGGEVYSLPKLMFAFMVSGYFMTSIMGCGSDLLFAHYKKTKVQMLFFLIGVGVSILTNILLTPQMKICGVILSSFNGVLFIFICHYFFLRVKQFKSIIVFDVFIWSSLIVLTGLLVDKNKIIPVSIWYILQGIIFLVLAIYSIYLLAKIPAVKQQQIKFMEKL